jgi:glycosyltransferase involved in cell wall biosynthesis
MNILQVTGRDIDGGAERIAQILLSGYRERGHGSWLAVGAKRGDDPDVLPIPRGDSAVSRQLDELATKWRGTQRRPRRLSRTTSAFSHPIRWTRRQLGVEDFSFPGCRKLLNLPPQKPDLLHCHNLHRDYFDLRLLPELSRQLPVVLTLHDPWLFTGHCGHFMNCMRWQTGCGQCPSLSVYPAVERDATHFNWKRKKAIYADSRVYVSSPCQWLIEHARQSILAPAIVESRVIHNPVDQSIFCPGDVDAARTELGVPVDADVLLFSATYLRRNVFKDYAMIAATAERLGARKRKCPLILIALGEDAPPERAGSAVIRFVPFQSEPRIVAQYHRAADVYLHAAKVETFPNSIVEALSCGIPVVATAVGGIPEQIRSLDSDEPANGILVQPRDPAGMAEAVEKLLADEPLRRRLSANAVADARRRFSLPAQVEQYLGWFAQITDSSARVERRAA